MKHPIGQTSNGIAVYVDLIHSKAAAHIAQHPPLLGLIKETLSQTIAHDENLNIEHDMGRMIGYNFVVKTAERDQILYAKLVRDDVYTRFVKNGKPRPSQYLTIVLHYDENGEYELLDTWIGHTHPPKPGSNNETDESRTFWANHAHILDKQSLQSHSATKECPY